MEEALLLPVVDSLSILQSSKPIGNKYSNHFFMSSLSVVFIVSVGLLLKSCEEIIPCSSIVEEIDNNSEMLLIPQSSFSDIQL